MDFPNLDLFDKIVDISRNCGFAYVGVAGTNLLETEIHLGKWIENGFNADLDYMSKHGTKRTRPEELEPWTRSIIVFGMNYLPQNDDMKAVLFDPNKAYISRYSLGRDYHKVLKKRLNTFAKLLGEYVGEFKYRAFVDSAPVMERDLAKNAGVGWIGKNAMLINPTYGSFCFLGILYTNLDIIATNGIDSHCGTCDKCIESCPTGAIVAPYEVDARRCISYLTIENKDAIPIELRDSVGNKIFGCDDCQICCPWNRFAKPTDVSDFKVRNNLDSISLKELFMWSELDFYKKTEGMSIRRVGYDGWLRNIAVALGNGSRDSSVINLLIERKKEVSPLVVEHIDWAISKLLSS